MRALKQTVRLALTASAVVAGSIAVAGPANAASSPIEACGGSYHEVDHQNITGAVIHLLYNGSSNCVVTWKTDHIGTATPVAAVLRIAGQPIENEAKDADSYKYYAGPVYKNAAGKCIVWGGQASGAPWTSPPEHCG
ncbi:hypothetical protein ACQP1G_34060 [Nocardia sp. CA-107356]|uniref:hypothetical protein n=1 Tax=Nocardia sp. CA-107356 TaxID=3239972 RepID=UPI003D8C8F07